jgi:hypothetical protein
LFDVFGVILVIGFSSVIEISDDCAKSFSNVIGIAVDATTNWTERDFASRSF